MCVSSILFVTAVTLLGIHVANNVYGPVVKELYLTLYSKIMLPGFFILFYGVSVLFYGLLNITFCNYINGIKISNSSTEKIILKGKTKNELVFSFDKNMKIFHIIFFIIWAVASIIFVIFNKSSFTRVQEITFNTGKDFNNLYLAFLVAASVCDFVILLVKVLTKIDYKFMVSVSDKIKLFRFNQGEEIYAPSSKKEKIELKISFLLCVGAVSL